ncbi:MAG: alkaline phosphatase [Actinobacteria bacterium]|nr:alkaline phosphatase [Actinomycetota bacterium]
MRKFWFLRLFVAIFVFVGSAGGEQAKYIFLMIGDGMGVVQRSAAEQFSRSCGNGQLVMNSLPAHGLTTTHSYQSLVTDSAAAATAIACGLKTANGVISMDYTKKTKLKTLAEIAAERGMRVGIISSVSIDHATPACFYAHQPSRSNYYQIAMELAASDFEYFAGGSLYARINGRVSPLQAARENGFTIVRTRAQLMALTNGCPKVWSYNQSVDYDSALYYEIDRPKDHLSLVELTAKGIDLLDNSDGFFMMVEGGKIDWACHAHDAAAAIRDILAFDKSVAEALEFYQRHPQDTLIVVTADHETGGMTVGSITAGLGFSPQRLSRQNISGLQFSRTEVLRFRDEQIGFEKALPIIQKAFGLDDLSSGELIRLGRAYTLSMIQKSVRSKDEGYRSLYGSYDPLTTTALHILSSRAGIGWTTFSHTASSVATSAIGVGAESFDGYYDNTDIFRKIVSVMKSAQVSVQAQP